MSKASATVSTEKKKNASIDQTDSGHSHVGKSWLLHAFVVALAVGASFAIAGNYGEEIKQGVTQVYDYMTGPSETALQLKNMVSEIEELQEENAKLQQKVMQIMNKAKDRINGIESTDAPNQDRYYMHEFEEYFRVKPIDEIEIDPKLLPYFESYNIKEDPYYIQYKSECDSLNIELGPYIGRPSINDKRFYVAWNSNLEQYSLYASIDLPYKSVLGYYTGILQVRFHDVTDAWKYKATIIGEDGEPMYLVVDGRFKGNWFRYLRISSEEGNTEALLVPKDNMWYIVFRTKKPLEAGEEIVIGQGDIS